MPKQYNHIVDLWELELLRAFVKKIKQNANDSHTYSDLNCQLEPYLSYSLKVIYELLLDLVKTFLYRVRKLLYTLIGLILRFLPNKSQNYANSI